MKSTSTLLLWGLLFCFPFQVFSQKNAVSTTQIIKKYAHFKNTNPELNHENFFETMASAMHLSPQSKMVLEETVPSKTGFIHYKYQQYHENLPVFGNRYILHEKDGVVKTANGQFRPEISISSRPGIDAATAVAFAKQHLKARSYHPDAKAPVLCFIDPAFPKTSEILRLAYQVDLHSTEPFSKQRYFVDAATGKIITQFPLVLEEGVPSTAKTRYYGVQNIITDSIGPQSFILQDPTRGGGIFIYNNGGPKFTNTSATWDLSNAQMDEVALDAHFCTQEYYDMMLAEHNWQGQDGLGKALHVNVHIGNFANAFWDGESASFADGDCNYGPLTTLEVVGHEFTHGMIDYTSRLVYSSESGAINESLADMFGKMLERKTDPANFSWDLGHSFLLDPSVKPFRMMADPNALGMPAFYKGLYWVDFNGVHTNSSIGNLWFSMLVDGKQGVNELGAGYDVPALGMDKAGQIVFETNRNFLIENATYNDFYVYSLEVAESIFGIGSTEAIAVSEAWKAVGLPNVPPPIFDLSIVGQGFTSENICGLNQYIPVKFKVVNSGSFAYEPSMAGTVTLSSFSAQDFTFALTETIAPGAVFEIVVNDWLLSELAGSVFINGTLNLTDESIENNSDYTIYNVIEHTSNDLILYAEIVPMECFATEQRIGMFVVNNSCETVPAGAVMNFTATNQFGNVVWTSPPYTLENALSSGAAIFKEYTVPSTNAPLTYELIFANDPDPLNNLFEIETPNFLPITSNYLNDFEINFGQDNYLNIRGLSEPTMIYQGSHFFASSGYYQNPEDLSRCADVLAVFELENAPGLNADIRTCVDFSFSDTPILEFDLALFRNMFTDTSNFQYSSMLQAKWEGNENGNQIFFGQPEGQVQHKSIGLPPYFKGSLELRLYTELGSFLLDPGSLPNYDFVLLDNLKLSAPTSGTQDLTDTFPIQIAPNPSSDQVTVRAKNEIKSILLQNTNGQTLQSVQVNATSHALSLKGLASGLYFMNIQLDNGQTKVEKLIKMD